jgi:hypothetical protein
MTYDYNAASPDGAPNAPIDWVEEQFPPHVVSRLMETELHTLLAINLPRRAKGY